MVNCTFCGYTMPIGTGKMFVLKDGKIQYFCTKKCEKHIHKLGHKSRTTCWTKTYADVKAANKTAGASVALAKDAAAKEPAAKNRGK